MLELALNEARAAPGEIVHGRVHARDGTTHVTVELVRLEQSPIGLATYRVASAEIAHDGTFAVAVPEGAPPDVAGRDCSLRYALRAISAGEEVRSPFSVTL
jgi:hypothetical protein